MKKQWTTIAILAALLSVGCSTVALKAEKENLVVQTLMEESIFLDPVAEHVVWVQVRNTTGEPRLNVSPAVIGALNAKGVKMTNDPKKASAVLQVNVRNIQRSSQTAAQANAKKRVVCTGLFESQCYEETVDTTGSTGALLGGLAGSLAGSSGSADEQFGVLLGATLGALFETKAANKNQDVTYTLATDLVIRERTPQKDWKDHQTKVISTANQVNLDIDSALPQMFTSLANSISGLF